MPEIPGNNAVPGTGIPPGKPPGQLGLTSAGPGGAVRGATGPEQPLASASQPAAGKRFFGFHTDASIMARLASMGVSPTLGNLRVAQQLLRYGQGLDAELLGQVSQAWASLGGGDAQRLEAIVALMARGLPLTGVNVQAMAQLLGGGPLAHVLARLTMAVKAEQNPRLGGIGAKLNSLWQLGHLERDLLGQLKDFSRLTAGLREEIERLGSTDVGPETAQELGRLRDLLAAQRLLAEQQPQALYQSFFVWRDHQPLPAEILVQEEGGGTDHVTSFLRLTLAVETLSMGRVVAEFVYAREALGVKFDVADDKVKKRVEPRLTTLRQRLSGRGYAVEHLTCRPDGAGRSISTLLPVRRDLKKLSRAQGVL